MSDGNLERMFPSAIRRMGPLSDQQVGPYKLDRMLGVGTYSSVYQATHLRLRAQRALKILRPDLNGNTDIVQQFSYEGRVTAALNHPNIIRLHDIGFQEPSETAPTGYHYIGMDYVDGGPLSSIFDGRRRPAVSMALSLIAQVGAGLEHAHRAKVVHNDLKPGNILLGKDGQVRITDFGSARKLDWTVLKGQSFAPTANYCAPEVLDGEESTMRSDIYSFGAVSFELLTGRTPVAEGSSNRQDLTAALDQAGITLSPRFKAGVVDAITQQLSQDPDQRPESLEDYLRGLRQRRLSRSSRIQSGKTAEANTNGGEDWIDNLTPKDPFSLLSAVWLVDPSLRNTRLLLQKRETQAGLLAAGVLLAIFVGGFFISPKKIEPAATATAVATRTPAIISATSTEVPSVPVLPQATSTPIPAEVIQPEPEENPTATPTRRVIVLPSTDTVPLVTPDSPGTRRVIVLPTTAASPARLPAPPAIPDSAPRLPRPPGGFPDSKPRGMLPTPTPRPRT